MNGKGIRRAIFDVGFSGADRNPAFDHLRAANRIVKTYDFVKNKEDVYQGGSHGTSVWSCIGGKVDGKWSGLAWDAEFLLARTELASREPFSEEENWVAAAEWADQLGADIINSSLGYTNKRYFPEQM
ncbi:MAG: S8 family serine peptidase, partial [bacterium]